MVLATKKCQGWCPPTVIYLVLSIATTFFSLMTAHKYDDMLYEGKNKVVYTISHLFFIGLWTGILYWLCSSCYNTTAWVILLSPVITLVILLVLLLFSNNRGINLNNSFRYN